jgi:hypothetical protein
VRDGGIGCGLGVADDMKIWRGRGELIAVRHPHLSTVQSAGRGLRIEQPPH